MGNTRWHQLVVAAAAVAVVTVLQVTSVHSQQQQVPGLAPEFNPAYIVPNVTTDCPVPVTLYSPQEFSVDKLYGVLTPLLNSDPNNPCVQAAPQLLVCVLDNSIQARQGCCSTDCAAQLSSYLVTTDPTCYRQFLNSACNTAIKDTIQGPLFNAARRCLGLQPSCDLLSQPGTLLPPPGVLDGAGGTVNTTSGAGGAANGANNATAGALPAASNTTATGASSGPGGGPSGALGALGRWEGSTAAAATRAGSRGGVIEPVSVSTRSDRAYHMVRDVSYARVEGSLGLEPALNISAVNGTGLNATGLNATQGQQNDTKSVQIPVQPRPALQQSPQPAPTQQPQPQQPQPQQQQQQQVAGSGGVNERLAAALQEVVAREAAGPPPVTAALDAYNPEPEKSKVELVTPEELWPTAAGAVGQG